MSNLGRLFLVLILAIVLVAAWNTPALAQSEAAPVNIQVGIGHSESTDAEEAGYEAARRASEAFGQKSPGIVLVLDGLADDPKVKEHLLKGVARAFPRHLIHGCSVYNAITTESNEATVGVMALGGDFEILTTLAALQSPEGHADCGRQIATNLKSLAAIDEAPRGLLILLGSCHVPLNDALTSGALSVLGEDFPIAGGAASQGEYVYHRGRVARGANVGILLSGPIETAFRLVQKEGAEAVIASAHDAFSEVAAEHGGKPALMLAFDCSARKGAMGDQLPRELEEMKKALPKDTPIFGFYGSGEIGRPDSKSPSRGVGFHLSAVGIFPSK